MGGRGEIIGQPIQWLTLDLTPGKWNEVGGKWKDSDLFGKMYGLADELELRYEK